MKYDTSTIKKVEKLKEQVDVLLPMKREDEKRLKKKFRLEFNYNSNHLEGNTLTYGQTQLLLFYDKSSGDVSVSDLEEMKAHDVAFSQVEDMAIDKERSLTEQFIKELNKIILVKPYWKDAITLNGTPARKKIQIGTYKTTPNSVQLKSGEIHEHASPTETPSKMSDLMAWYNENLKEMHPAQLSAEFHYRFVCIHPFDDGNGRVARLLMNYILLKNDYPPAIVKYEDKENYLTALQKADIGDKLAIIEYLEKQLVWSLELKIKAAKGEDIQEMEDIKKEVEILRREKESDFKVRKSPKVVYELVKFINDEFCRPLFTTLKEFDDFFYETKTFLHNTQIEFKDINFHDIEDIPVIQTDIHRYNLKEKNSNKIIWTIQMDLLKTINKDISYAINCILFNSEFEYKLLIEERNNETSLTLINERKLFEEEREYKSYFTKDDFDKIIKIVANHLIKVIREQE